MAQRDVFQFGSFELDAPAYELRRGGARVRLARQPMDLLFLLVDRPGELVSRDEIARALWSEDVFVDLDAGIHTAVLRIRQALGAPGDRTTFVETVPGKGYRFIAPVIRVTTTAENASRSTPGAASAACRHDLPSELTSFIGRDRELEELPRLLASTRVLSLIGAGGVGKTRVAVRLASNLLAEFPDGVWLADLGALSAPGLVAETIARALGLRESSHRPPREALLAYCRDRTALLVLDTCEHLLASCAEIVEALVREAPRLRILATSREALGVPGEVAYRVPSLSLPAEATSVEAVLASDAGRLFMERAHAADPAFRPGPEGAAAVSRICRRLDGIPLAIELAAARVPAMAPQEIEVRLHDRFRLLTGGARTAVARQRTLEATVEWSVQLLTDAERLLLDRLSVFPASWTVEAAEGVCAGEGVPGSEVLDLLARLVNKSLVVLERDAVGRSRYRLLDTVRGYVRARLTRHGATDRLRSRHFTFFFDRFRESQRILRGAGQRSRLQQLRAEHENTRAALEWAFTSGSSEHGAELAGALFWYWTKCGLFEEGKRWLRQAVEVPAPPGIHARALIGLAHMHHFQGDQTRVAALGSEAMRVGRDIGDGWAESVGLFLQALAAFELGDVDRARATARAALDAADACGDEIERGAPLMVLANVALVRGNQEEALGLYDESIDVHRRAGEAWGLSILLSIAAGLRIMRDDFQRARLHAAEALSLSQALEDPRGIAWSLEVYAGLLAAGGREDAAARLWGLSDSLMETSGGALTATIGGIRERYLEQVTAAMGESFAAVREEGRRMSVDEVSTVGLA